MAQEQRNVTIAAPGFAGINTQDSPLTQGSKWAATADNCVIDAYGRIGARKGHDALTSSVTALSGESIESIHEFIAKDGTTVIFSAGNSKIFSGTTTLVDITPGAYTITGDDWDIDTLNDHAYFFQRGHEPLIYEKSSSTLMKMSSKVGYAATAPQANIVISAYGRLWAADVTGNKHTVCWSDLLMGYKWTTGTSGSLDLTTVWPHGTDEITGLAAHNNLLVIFGKECIVVYGSSATDGNLSDPAADLFLQDVIVGIGCVSRHTIQAVGNDLMFLDGSGVRSLARVIQEKSLPIGDISRNVRRDIQTAISAETGVIYSAFSVDEGFYIVGFPSQSMIYCFDMRGFLEDGSARVTTWSSVPFKCAWHSDNGTLYFGTVEGISTYTGYTDNGTGYLMAYYSNPITFDEPSLIKIPKQLDVTVIGGPGTTFTLLWSYDYSTTYKAASISIASTTESYYNVSEFNIAEYASPNTVVLKRANLTGSGRALTIGFQSTVNGTAIDIQEFNIQALIGRIL